MGNRAQIGESVNGVDRLKACAAVRACGGMRPVEAYPDMGGWVGTNQPLVVAFTMPDGRDIVEDVLAEYERLGGGCDTEFGNRAFCEERRSPSSKAR